MNKYIMSKSDEELIELYKDKPYDRDDIPFYKEIELFALDSTYDKFAVFAYPVNDLKKKIPTLNKIIDDDNEFVVYEFRVFFDKYLNEVICKRYLITTSVKNYSTDTTATDYILYEISRPILTEDFKDVLPNSYLIQEKLKVAYGEMSKFLVVENREFEEKKYEARINQLYEEFTSENVMYELIDEFIYTLTRCAENSDDDEKILKS